MAEVRYHGVNHLALITNDMDKTVRFYKDVLGMKVVGTLAGGSGSNRMRHYFFSLGPGSTIAFFEWPWVELPPPKDSGAPASGRNFDHVSITVESEEDFAVIRERMAKAGLPVSDTVDHGMVRSIYFEDLNGVSLEFSVWQTDLEKEPSLMDPDPVPALKE